MDRTEGERAFNEISRTFSEYIVNYDEEPWVNANEKLEKFQETLSTTNDEFSSRFNTSIQVIDAALDEFE